MKRRMQRWLAMFLSVIAAGSCLTAGGALRAAAITAADAAAWARAQGNARIGFDLDAHYGYQCSDFVTAYMNYLVDGDAYSGRYMVYDAKEYPDVAAAEPERWLVLRGSGLQPQAGDIVIMTGFEKKYGHASVFLGMSGKKYLIVDQNTSPIDYDHGSPAYTHAVTPINDFAPVALIRYHFDTETYTLTYNANGGEAAPAAQTGSGSLQLTATAPTRSGFAFLGWAESPAASAARYQPGDTVSLTADLTLYAVWQSLTQPQPTNPTANAVLRVRPSAAVEYKADVTLTATATGVPAGYVLAVYEGGTQRAAGSNESVSFHIGSMTKGRTFTVRVLGPDGAQMRDGSGAELAANTEIKVSDSFLSRLIAVFKGLFRLLPKVEIRP